MQLKERQGTYILYNCIQESFIPSSAQSLLCLLLFFEHALSWAFEDSAVQSIFLA